jgi:hypothetical protein
MVAPNHTISPTLKMATGSSTLRIFLFGKQFQFRHFADYNRHHTTQ